MNEATYTVVSKSGVRRRLGPTGFLMIVAASSLLLAACGAGSGNASHPSSSVPRRTSVTKATSTPGGGADAAVLAAYRASWSAFEHAAADANPEDPELASTMVDPQLQSVKANLLADQRQGIVGRGTFTLHPRIVALSATTATATATATVADCAYSTAVLVYSSTGKAVPPITPPENDGVQATLVLTGGTWKVYKQTVTDGSCAPGS